MTPLVFVNFDAHSTYHGTRLSVDAYTAFVYAYVSSLVHTSKTGMSTAYLRVLEGRMYV